MDLVECETQKRGSGVKTIKARRRKITNFAALSMAYLAMAFGLFFLGAILWTLIKNGLPALTTHIFTRETPPPGSAGGLRNAIVGSAFLTGTATLIGTPLGILAGTYLAEFNDKPRWVNIVRLLNEILLSAPSIVIGFFIYAVIVARTGHFSGWAGAAALTVILVPVIVTSTENMLKMVPSQLREAAAALGAPRWRVVWSISYRSAKTGILTGVLLAIARISGETAPLLFTSLNNQFWSTNMSKPMASLPIVIFQFAMSPYNDWQHLAWAGALLITLGVLALNVMARLFGRSHQGVF